MKLGQEEIEELGIIMVPEEDTPEEYLGRPGLTREELKIYVELRTAQVYGVYRGRIWPSDAAMLLMLQNRVTYSEDLWVRHIVYDRTSLVEVMEFDEGTMIMVHGQVGIDELLDIGEQVAPAKKKAKRKTKHRRKF